MANSANVEGGLSTHDLRRFGGEGRDVLIVLRFEFIRKCVEFVYFLLGQSDDVLHQLKIKIIKFEIKRFSFISSLQASTSLIYLF